MSHFLDFRHSSSPDDAFTQTLHLFEGSQNKQILVGKCKDAVRHKRRGRLICILLDVRKDCFIEERKAGFGD